MIQHCPTPTELDDLELLVSGAYAPVTRFNEPGSPVTLALPDGATEAELVDPEGLPLARVAADGSLEPLTHAQYGPFRRLHLTPAQAREQHAGATFVPVVDALTGPPFARLTVAHGAYLSTTARWWTGDALGVLIVGSVLLAWATAATVLPTTRRSRAEADLALLATGVLAWAVFWRWSTALAYLALVPVGWMAQRYGARGATAVSLTACPASPSSHRNCVAPYWDFLLATLAGLARDR